MKKFAVLIFLTVFTLILIPFRQAYAINKPAELAVVTVRGSDNTDPAKPVWHLYDGNPQTVWATTPASPEDAWLEITLSEAAVIDYLQIDGTLSGAGDVSISYAGPNGVWQPFVGRSHCILSNRFVDLSWSRARSDRLRLLLHNSSQAQVLGNIGEIHIYGHKIDDLVRLQGQVTVSNEITNYPAGFLTDNNTYTSWRASGNMASSVTCAFSTATPVQKVKFFNRNGAGTISGSAQVNGSWIPFGTPVDLSTLPAGWHVIDIPDDMATAIKLNIVPGSAGYTGGLAEFEVWGSDTVLTNQQTLLLGENFTGAASFGFELDDPSAWNEGAIWLTLPAGTINLTPSITVNGNLSTAPISLSPGENCTLGKLSLDIRQLRSGHNSLTIDSKTANVLEASIVIAKSNGRLAIHSINSQGAGLLGLYDGLLFQGSSAVNSTIDIELVSTASIDYMTLYGLSLSGLVNVNLSVWQNNGWTPVDPAAIRIEGTVIKISGGTIPTSKIRIQTNSQIIASLNEVEVYGSIINQGAPVITITGPEEYSVISPGINLTGFVDNSEVTLTVDGQPVSLQGHFFSCPAPVPPLNNGPVTVTASAVDSQGRSSQVSRVFNTSQPPGLTCNLAEVSYTATPLMTVQGSANSAVSVKLNGVSAVLYSGSYSGQVNLNEGENSIKIEATDGLGAIATLQRQIILDTQPPVIRLTDSCQGMTVYTPALQLNGSCNDATAVTLTVNNQPVSVIKGSFTASVTLYSGLNNIIIRAIDAVGNVKSASYNVNYILPVINITAPAQGAVLNTSTVTISGSISGATPAKVTVNRQEVVCEPNGSFSTQQTLPDGYQTITVVVELSAGIQITQTQAVTVDTVPPKNFTVSTTPTGWTNDPRPSFIFKTTDITSGIDHYEIRLDDGNWINPATSPYQFSQDIPEGPHTVEVKTVDRAGNTKTSQVQNSLVMGTSGSSSGNTLPWGINFYQTLATTYSTPNMEVYNTYFPYNSYFENNKEAVSTASGSLNINAVDLVLPGCNGFDLVIKRTYSSDLAQEEGFKRTNTYRDQNGQIINGTTQYTMFRTPPVATFNCGWSLNIPWIETINGEKFLRFPEGQYVKFPGSYDFDYHEGIHFHYDASNKELTLANGMKYRFNSSGQPTLFWDPRYTNSVIHYYYSGKRISSITDSLNRQISFQYKTLSLDFNVTVDVIQKIEVSSPSSSNKITVDYFYDHNRLYRVEDPKDRSTVYDYKGYQVSGGADIHWTTNHIIQYHQFYDNTPTNQSYLLFPNNQAPVHPDGNEDWPTWDTPDWPYEYGVYNSYQLDTAILHSITYPTKAVSVYDYSYQDQYTGNCSWETPGQWEWQKHIDSIDTNNGYGYSYEAPDPDDPDSTITINYYIVNLSSDKVTGVFYGGKWLVQKHTLGTRVTTYDATMNLWIGNMQQNCLIKPKTYLKSMKITDGNKEVIETYKQVYKDPHNAYQWADDQYIEPQVFDDYTPPRNDYRGALLATKTISIKASNGTFSEVERNEYQYNFPIQAVTQDIKKRNGAVVCTDTYDYSDWGNLKKHSNSVTQNLQNIDYYSDSTYHNLIKSDVTQNYNPVTNQTTTLSKTYAPYNNGKPTDITMVNGAQTSVLSYQYNTDGSLWKTTDQNGLVTEFGYDANHLLNQKNLTLKSDDQDVLDAAGNPISTLTYRYHYDPLTGLKEWEMEPRGYTTIYRYDPLNRVTKIFLPDDNDQPYVTPVSGQDPTDQPYREYNYNDDANTCTFWNENRQRSLFTFDGLGRVTGVTKYHNGQALTTTYNYDELGRITSVIDPRADLTNAAKYTTSYQYDGLDRLTQITYPQDTLATASFSYDDLTNTTTFNQGNKTVIEQKDWANRLILAQEICRYPDEPDKTFSWNFEYDSMGNQVKITNPKTLAVTQDYDTLGHMLKLTMPLTPLVIPGTTDKSAIQNPGNVSPVISYTYNAAGNILTETSANGNSVATPDNYVVSYTYDALGHVKTATRKSTKTNLTTGLTTLTTSVASDYYDAAGNKVKTVDPKQGNWKYTYSARGFLLSEQDPRGNLTQYRYDPVGNKIAAIDPRNNDAQNQVDIPQVWYSYDGNGQLSLTDSRADKGFTAWYLYDDLNRLWRTVLPDKTPPGNPYITLPNYDNPYSETGYDEAGNKTLEQDANGVKTTYSYNGLNWLKTKTDNQQRQTQILGYDNLGNQTTIQTQTTTGVYSTTTKSYDSLGRLRKIAYPKGNSENYNYDKLGNRTKVTDGNQHVTTYTYNNLNQLTAVTDPLLNTTSYRYDPNGNPVATIMPNGIMFVDRYDEMNRPVEQIDTLDLVTKYNYDLNGNRKNMLDPRGTLWTYNYYSNNLLEQLNLTSADGKATYSISYEYDPAGNRTKVTDTSPLLNVITYNDQGADPLNRINSIQREFDGKKTYRTSYEYDKAGQMTSITYPSAQQPLVYRYNNLNQLQEVAGFTKPQGITYDIDGNVNGISYINGVNTVLVYDPNRQLEDLNISSTNSNILKYHYSYDWVGNITQIHNGLSNQDYDYHYYDNNWLQFAKIPATFIENQKTPGTLGFKTGDYLGKSSLDFNLDSQAIISIDSNASSIGVNFGTQAPAIKKIQFVPANAGQTQRLTKISFDLYVSNDNSLYTVIPNPEWDYERDANGMITITLQNVHAAQYLKIHIKIDPRDPEFLSIGGSQFRVQDMAAMLRIYQQATSVTEEYHYDFNGNRNELKVTQVQTVLYDSSQITYYANSNRLRTDGKFAYDYDNAGNLIKKGNTFSVNGAKILFTTSGAGVVYWEYDYDLMNRLIEVRKNGAPVADYGYDPEGFRVVKRANGLTTHYVFEGTEPIFEKQIETGKIKSYIYALGKPLARVDGVLGDSGAPKYFYHTDHIGSIKTVTDINGNRVWDADYLAFGNQFTKSSLVPGFEEWHGFTGKEFDPDTGLYYFNARWYDPDLGRFISEDPALDPNNPNLYTYGRNNPLTITDPTGKYTGADDAGLFVGGGLLNAGFELGYQVYEGKYDPTKVFTAFIKGGLSAWLTEYTGAGGMALYAFLDGVEAGVRKKLAGEGWDGSFNQFAQTFWTDMVSGLAAGALGKGISKVVNKIKPLFSEAMEAFLGRFKGINPEGGYINLSGFSNNLLTDAGQVADHHIIPAFRGNMAKYAKFIKDRGVDVDLYTVTVSHGKASQHLKFIHGEGKWNQKWIQWIEEHPNATAKDIYQFAGKMMDEFGLSGLTIHPYGK